jgi:hypothetical protein
MTAPYSGQVEPESLYEHNRVREPDRTRVVDDARQELALVHVREECITGASSRETLPFARLPRLEKTPANFSTTFSFASSIMNTFRLSAVFDRR